MVLVSSSCPTSRGCTHMFLSTPSLSSSPVKGLSVLEIKVLNGGNANDLHICSEGPEKESKALYNWGEKCIACFSVQGSKDLLD